MAMKWFEVEVRAIKMVMVEMDEDDYEDDPEGMLEAAISEACTEAFSFCETEGVGSEVDPRRVENAKKNADDVVHF